jgi:hypothetical protein
MELPTVMRWTGLGRSTIRRGPSQLGHSRRVLRAAVGAPDPMKSIVNIDEQI